MIPGIAVARDDMAAQTTEFILQPEQMQEGFDICVALMTLNKNHSLSKKHLAN